MRAPELTRLGVCGVVLIAIGCGRSPTAPASSETGSPTHEAMFTVIDGWSRAPVVGAAVTANGLQVLTDGSGRVRFAATKSCITLDVTVTGYLDRRTCASSPGQVTLWPMASAEEAAATRTWMFTRDQISGEYWSFPIAIILSPELATRSDLAATWRSAADAITQVSQGRITFDWVIGMPDEGLVIEAAGTAPSCAPVQPWLFEVSGFCVDYDPAVYFLDHVRVRSDLLTDRSTAMRAVLSSIGMRTHSLPGLMNAIRPQSELTEFERKTLGMLGQRRRTITWPDFDVQ